MSEDHNKPGWMFWATVVVVGLLMGYVGAYVGMARAPRIFIAAGHGPYELADCYFVAGRQLDHQDFWRAVFAPVHEADRHIRREKWILKNFILK